MVRRWVWAIGIGLVLVGGGTNSDAAGIAFHLAKIETLCVGVDSTASVEKKFRLTTETLRNQVYVLLKRKLPRLKQIDQFTGEFTGACVVSAPTLVILVNLDITGTKVAYFGHVAVILVRPTTWESGNVGLGYAYYIDEIMSGPIDKVRSHLNEILDELLTFFAAEYYKAGNP